jgi:hypothetical protein
MSEMHAGLIDESWIMRSDATLAALARPFLEDPA